jgi:hypothetical protein
MIAVRRQNRHDSCKSEQLKRMNECIHRRKNQGIAWLHGFGGSFAALDGGHRLRVGLDFARFGFHKRCSNWSKVADSVPMSKPGGLVRTGAGNTLRSLTDGSVERSGFFKDRL